MIELLAGDIRDRSAPLLVGHSHRYALLHSPTRPKGLICHKETPDGSYWDDLVDIARGRTVLLSWRGNQHNNYLFSMDTPYLLLPKRFPQPLASNKPYIPFTMATEMLKACHIFGHELPQLIDRFKREARTLYVLGTPPPKSEAAIRVGLLRGTEAYSKRAIAFGFDPSEVELTPIGTRVALWQALQEIVEQACGGLGVQFLPSPPDAQDSDGSLLDACAAPDVTHANAAFGTLMWAALARAET